MREVLRKAQTCDLSRMGQARLTQQSLSQSKQCGVVGKRVERFEPLNLTVHGQESRLRFDARSCRIDTAIVDVRAGDDPTAPPAAVKDGVPDVEDVVLR
jgi:hypothetical protein